MTYRPFVIALAIASQVQSAAIHSEESLDSFPKGKMQRDLHKIDAMFHRFEHRVAGHIHQVQEEKKAAARSMAERDHEFEQHEKRLLEAAKKDEAGQVRSFESREKKQTEQRLQALRDIVGPSSLVEEGHGIDAAPFSKFASWLEGKGKSTPSSLLETDSKASGQEAGGVLAAAELKAKEHDAVREQLWAKIDSEDAQVHSALKSLHAQIAANGRPSFVQIGGDAESLPDSGWQDAKLKVQGALHELSGQIDDARESGDIDPLSAVHMRTD